MSKRWRVTINEPDGRGGRQDRTYGQRGPENAVESKQAALRDVVRVQTKRALRSGADDPLLKFVKTEFVGELQTPLDALGDETPLVEVPAGGKAVDFEKFSKKNPDGTAVNSVAAKLAAEEG